VSTVSRTDSTELLHELVATFGAFGPSYMKWVTAHARDRGITFARMKTLHSLQCGGPKIMSALRDELGVTARSVTALVDALEAEDMVRRVPHPTDRRATIVELTDTGQRTVEGQFEAHRERAAELFTELSEQDQRELLRIMRILSQALADRGVELGWGPRAAPGAQPGGMPPAV
jgi:DNA-binding MarR family transcriptional regulator